MTEISAHLVKELREKTGAGMMDCKKALQEVEGNVEKAIDWLRKKGLSAAAKKADRVTAEGVVGVMTKGNWGAVLEVNSETDFVARNSTFQNFVSELLECIADQRILNPDALMKASLTAGKTIEEELSLQIATIGESLSIRRLQALEVNQGIVASYIHNSVTPSMGKIAVLVGLESEASSEALTEIGKKIAMHVAAAKPLFLRITDVEPQFLEHEKNIFLEQAKASGRPENVIEKMVEGRLRKYFEEIVLEEQVFVFDGATKIKEVLKEYERKLNHPIQLTGFVRIELGEGVEKLQTDFAAEVNAQIR